MLSSSLLLPLAAAGSIFLAILGIGFLIFVHELGHYLACRITGTRVETFSIGFGTRLFGWESKPGEPRRFTVGRRQLDATDHAMDFRIALVPLGGYVKMAGEALGEARTGAPDEFPSKSIGARVLIVSAGVIMNVITAFAFYLIAFASHIQEEPPVVGLAEPGGPGWEAGLEPGDRIVEIGDKRVRSFLELKMETVFLPAGEPVDVRLVRDGQERTLQIVPRYDDEAGAILMRILPGRTLTLRDGEKTWRVGPTERIRVDGVPATGGLQVAGRIEQALQRGTDASVALAREDGETWELRWRPDPDTEGERKPPRRVGIVQFVPPVVDTVRGPAARVLQAGDRVVAALRGGERIEITNAPDFQRLAFQAPVDHLVVDRGTEAVSLPIPGQDAGALQAWLDGVSVKQTDEARVTPLGAGHLDREADGIYRYTQIPSRDAGIRAGDRIVKVGEKEIGKWMDVVDAIRAAPEGATLSFSVLRDGSDEPVSLAMTPAPLEPLLGPELEVEVYTEPFETDGLFDAAGVALARTGTEIRNVFRLIGAFFTGSLSFKKNVGGPVTIVTVSSQAAQVDWLKFLMFLAYISVTLAVLNILPIPILDGGWLMFILIEKVKGSPLKEETMGKLQLVGLMLLLVLMFFAFANDFKLVTR